MELSSNFILYIKQLLNTDMQTYYLIQNLYFSYCQTFSIELKQIVCVSVPFYCWTIKSTMNFEFITSARNKNFPVTQILLKKIFWISYQIQMFLKIAVYISTINNKAIKTV